VSVTGRGAQYTSLGYSNMVRVIFKRRRPGAQRPGRPTGAVPPVPNAGVRVPAARRTAAGM